jgi:hypothetical protein
MEPKKRSVRMLLGCGWVKERGLENGDQDGKDHSGRNRKAWEFSQQQLQEVRPKIWASV